MILEVAEIIGELAASGCPDQATLANVLRAAADNARQKAAECWPNFEQMKRRN